MKELFLRILRCKLEAHRSVKASKRTEFFGHIAPLDCFGKNIRDIVVVTLAGNIGRDKLSQSNEAERFVILQGQVRGLSP